MNQRRFRATFAFDPLALQCWSEAPFRPRHHLVHLLACFQVVAVLVEVVGSVEMEKVSLERPLLLLPLECDFQGVLSTHLLLGAPMLISLAKLVQ